MKKFCHKTWMRAVRILITVLEADLRGRALDWLYAYVERDAMQPEYGRYDRPGGRYHREPRP